MNPTLKMPRSFRVDSFRRRAETLRDKAARADAHGALPRAAQLRAQAAELIRQGAVMLEDEYSRLRALDQALANDTMAAAVDARTLITAPGLLVAA